MKNQHRVMVAHSDVKECGKIKSVLEDWGYEVSLVHNFTESLGKTQHSKDILSPCAILLGKGAENASHASLIKNIRKAMAAPILYMSRQKDEAHVVEALDSGAHDFIKLPFGSSEHRARIRAAIRDTALRPKAGAEFETDGLRIVFDSRDVYARGKHVKMTPIEFRLLTLLAMNAGKVVTHEELITDVWGPYTNENLVLRVNMANIRKKIEENPSEPKIIQTETGVGYRMIAPS